MNIDLFNSGLGMATTNDTGNLNGPYGLFDGIQIPSAATCMLSLFQNDTKLSTASSFLIEDLENLYLVTALHNFSGRNFFTRKCLSPKLATPNKFQATVRIKGDGGDLNTFEMKGDLFSNGTPIFLYDWSENGGDIAIIRLPKEHDHLYFATMNDTPSQDWSVFAGLDVYALGYPSALDVNRTPIWKNISIASEPSQKVNGINAILTDGLTYSGMSGGPVIINQTQGFTNTKSYLIGAKLAARLLGVYGGRFDADTEKSGTLGFYWPIEIVHAIIAEDRQVGKIDSE